MPVQPSEKEEQFFREQELKARLHKLAHEQELMAVAEKRRLKELHWMHCPKCGQQLAMEQYGRWRWTFAPAARACGWMRLNWRQPWRAQAEVVRSARS